jgi:hypothetical protein
MATIRLSELFQRVNAVRSDLIQEKASLALAEAARRVASDTNLLRMPTYFTLAEDAYEFSPVLPNGRSVGTVLTVESFDADLDRWIQVKGPYSLPADGESVDSEDPTAPYKWATVGGKIYFGAPADDDYQMRANVSWVPARYPIPEEVEFPKQCEEALINWAISLLFLESGQGQNFKESKSAKNDYNNELSGLCALSRDGEGASRSINDWLPYEV